MLCLVNRSFSYHHTCFSSQDWLYQLFYICATVLIVRICIYDNIRTISETCIETCHETSGKSLIVSEVHDVINSPVSGHFYSIICTSIVNNQIFNHINTINMFWQIIQCYFQCLRLVITWNLNYQLHSFFISPFH